MNITFLNLYAFNIVALVYVKKRLTQPKRGIVVFIIKSEYFNASLSDL